MEASSLETRQELLQSEHVFEVAERPRRDSGWTIAFVVCLLLTLAIGAFAAANRDSRLYLSEEHEFWKDPQNCPYSGRKLGEGTLQDKESDERSPALHMITWILTACLGSIGLGVGYIMLFKLIPEVMVVSALAFQVTAIAILGLFYVQVGRSKSDLAGVTIQGYVVLIIAAVLARLYYRWRREVRLCARLLAVSAVGLEKNPRLILFTTAMKLLELSLQAPIVAMIYAAWGNGTIVPNAERQGRGVCENSDGVHVPCCTVEKPDWVPFYMLLAILMVVWVYFLSKQLQTFVIGGSIAQWYFAPVSAQSTKGRTSRSLRHAFGPSFGTLSCGAVVLLFIEGIRNFLYRSYVLRCFLSAFEAAAGSLTKFAIIMASITGEDFLDAGRRSTALLVRNLMKSFGVWWIPSAVLNTTSFMLSIFWALFVFILHTAATGLSDEYSGAGFIIAYFGGCMAALVLTFFSSILLNIVDTCYLCYALDRDRQVITKEEVHEVFSKVPVAAKEDADGYTYVPPNDLNEAVRPPTGQAQA